MTTCPPETILASYVDHRLSQAERNTLEQHLADCPRCVGLVVSVFKMLRDMNELPMDATYVNAAGHLKPIKSGPKQYKVGEGPTGQARLQRRVNSLLLAASRLAKKSPDADEAAWAERLADMLKVFNNTLQGSGS